MNTFPHINYHTMRDTYEKCERIISLLESSLPIGKSVEDYIGTLEYDLVDDYYESLDSSSFGNTTYSKGGATAKMISFPDVTGVDPLANKFSVPRNIFDNQEWYTADEFIDKNVRMESKGIKSGYAPQWWMQEPQYAFHKSVYEQTKKAIKAMKSESDVNTLNINLASALQFLEELDEVDLNEGIYQYDTDIIGEKVKQATENKVNELQRQYDAEYEEQLEEFKAKLNELMSDGAEGGKEEDAEKEDHSIYNEIFDSHEPATMESKSNQFLNGFFTALAVMLVAFALYLLLK